jgi:hypothetical protein
VADKFQAYRAKESGGVETILTTEKAFETVYAPMGFTRELPADPSGETEQKTGGDEGEKQTSAKGHGKKAKPETEQKTGGDE